MACWRLRRAAGAAARRDPSLQRQQKTNFHKVCARPCLLSRERARTSAAVAMNALRAPAAASLGARRSSVFRVKASSFRPAAPLRRRAAAVRTRAANNDDNFRAGSASSLSAVEAMKVRHWLSLGDSGRVAAHRRAAPRARLAAGPGCVAAFRGGRLAAASRLAP